MALWVSTSVFFCPAHPHSPGFGKRPAACPPSAFQDEASRVRVPQLVFDLMKKDSPRPAALCSVLLGSLSLHYDE